MIQLANLFPFILYGFVAVILLILLIVFSMKSKQQRKQKNTAFLLLFFIAVLFATSVTLFVTEKSSPFEIKRMSYDFVVNDAIGFNLDTDSLHFGSAPPGSRLERRVKIKSSRPSTMKISWVGEGVLNVDKNDFPMTDSIEVIFTLVVPEDLVTGNYGGEIVFRFYNN